MMYDDTRWLDKLTDLIHHTWTEKGQQHIVCIERSFISVYAEFIANKCPEDIDIRIKWLADGMKIAFNMIKEAKK